MENNEFEEVQVQFTEQDESLEISRSNKLRKIAFDCKAEVIKQDKDANLIGSAFLLVLLVVVSILTTRWLFPMYEQEVHSQEFLFWSAIVSGIVGCIVFIVFLSILYRKLRLKEALNDELPMVIDRFEEFKKKRKIGLIIGCVFGGLFVVFACCWVCASVSLPESAAPIIILSAALVCVIAAWIQAYYLRRLSAKCDEVIELLKV